MAKKTRAMTKRDQNAIQRYMRETMGELRKVSWPTRSEAIGLTQIVIVVMIIMAAILGGLDALFFEFFTGSWVPKPG